MSRSAPPGPATDSPRSRTARSILGRRGVRAGVTIDQLMKRLADLAGQEQRHYEDVLASRLLGRDQDRYRIFMKIRRSKIITVTYNTEHDVLYRRLGASRASARSVDPDRPGRRRRHAAGNAS